MAETQTIDLYLSQPQFLKYRKGLAFQLSNSQLQSDTGKNKVSIDLGVKDYNKLLKAINAGRGFRFSDKIVKGGSLWGSFKEGVKKVRAGVSKVGEKLGQAGKFIKDNVDPNFLKSVLDAGLDIVPDKYVNKKYKELAKSSANKAVDYSYDKDNEGKTFKENAFDLANKLKPELTEARYDAEDLALKKADKLVKKFKEKYIGEGIRAEEPSHTRPIKGSQEAKDRMARLRSMRKVKGSGMIGDILLPSAGMIVGQLAAGVPGAYVGSMLGTVAGKMIDGNGVKNTTHLKHGQLIDGVPRPVVSRQSAASIKKHGYHPKQRGKNGMHIQGGSFLELGGSMMALGGSFKSPGER
jgi:hypothetical protein